jgi:DNA-binding XRE family transcriptional regulator
MGWSQSDLARRLQLDSANIIQWELGASAPDSRTCQALSHLFQQAEMASLEMVSHLEAEVFMDEKHLESVDIRDLPDLKSKLSN